MWISGCDGTLHSILTNATRRNKREKKKEKERGGGWSVRDLNLIKNACEVLCIKAYSYERYLYEAST